MSGLALEMAYTEPSIWLHVDDETRERSSLDENVCIIHHDNGDIDRCIRCVLPISVPQIEKEFLFYVWMSISEDSLRMYQEGMADGNYEKDACFAYLMNDLPEFGDTLLMHANVYFLPNGMLPLVIMHEADHPLVEAQNHGMTLEQLEAITALSDR